MSARLSNDDELRTHINILPIDVLTRENLPEIRKIGEAKVAGMSPAAADSVLERRRMPVEEHEIELIIYRPSSTPSNDPAILWIHGGGYVLGTADDQRLPQRPTAGAGTQGHTGAITGICSEMKDGNH